MLMQEKSPSPSTPEVEKFTDEKGNEIGAAYHDQGKAKDDEEHTAEKDIERDTGKAGKSEEGAPD